MYTDIGSKGFWGVLSNPHPGGLWGFEGGRPREKKFGLFLAFFQHMVFTDGFSNSG
jgi:hypothetical protein